MKNFDFILLPICMYINVKDDKLLLDFSSKFRRQFIISHLNYRIATATFRVSQCQDGVKVFKMS